MTKRRVRKTPPRSAGNGDIIMGQRLRMRRTEQKMSQAELGDKLGVSFQQIQKYEKGVNRIGGVRLGKISEVLQVPVSYFYESNGKQVEVERLLFDDARFGIRLVRAFAAIPSEELKHQFVVMMEKVAIISMPRAAT